MHRLTSPSPECSVRFANLDAEVPARQGETVLDCAQRGGVRLACACGGRGSCGSCLIRVVSGAAELNGAGEEMGSLLETGADAEWVRACQVHPLADLVVEVSARAFAPALRPEAPTEEFDPPLSLDPLIQAIPVEPGRTLGLAIDLGTTNLAGSLTDLATGERLASHGVENPQAAFGADLISRIGHAIRTPEAGRELKQQAVRAIQELAEILCRQVAAAPGQIAEVALCGNTAMQHLVLGLPVAGLSRAPFTPATCDSADLKARELGLSLMPDAHLHVLPAIGGFVGGDHVAALLATEELWREGTSLLIDIGTNTEVSLILGGSISTASTASGPALEGGNISCGMRAARGAIEKVWLSGGEIRWQVIGGGAPVGLCGSGVLDALNVLHQAGVVNRRGYLVPEGPGVVSTGGVQEFPFAPRVSFTQNDVRAVLLAKGAIRAGIDLLLEKAGLGEEELDRVLIAGAFGAYLSIESAIAIGMLPALPPERFRQLGNAAGAGARMALVSAAARRRASELAKRCRHIELNGLPGFQKTFINRLGLS